MLQTVNNAPVLLSAQSVEVTDSTPWEDCALPNAATESEQAMRAVMMPIVPMETVAPHRAQWNLTSSALATDPQLAEPLA